MAVTYRPRKRTVPYRTRLTGRLIAFKEGFDADRIGPLTISKLVIQGRSVGPNPESGDSGLSLCEPRNDGGAYATISCSTFIKASGAVTFGAWLASSSK